MLLVDVFRAAASEIDYAGLREFVLAAEASDALTESRVLELKQKLDGRNVVKAVAGLANADGGVVLVGVREDAYGEARLVGITKGAVDGLVGQLRTLLDPPLDPEIIPIAVPNPASGDDGGVILVVRVDPDATDRPVTLAGTVYIRGFGATAPATRAQMLALLTEPNGASAGSLAGLVPLQVGGADTWPWPATASPEVQIRVQATGRLPPSAASRAVLDNRIKHRVLAELNSGPLAGLMHWLGDRRASGEIAWRFERARSQWLHASCALPPLRGAEGTEAEGVGARLYVQRGGRMVEVLVAVGLNPYRDGTGQPVRAKQGPKDETADGSPLRVELDELFAALVALRRTAASLVEICAGPDARVVRHEHAQAALVCADHSIDQFVALDVFPRDGDEELRAYVFPAAAQTDLGEVAVRRLVAMWLERLLLDLGASQFDERLRLLADDVVRAPRSGEATVV
jgi:Putative DNA-binding domain